MVQSCIWPFPPEEITSGFRIPTRPNHDGIDFGSGLSNIEGSPIPATAAGIVEVAGVYFGYGNTVIINHGALVGGPYDGQTLQTLYGHMVDPGPIVDVGANVAQGQTLGGIGNTGQSEGNHLHWETWIDGEKIDPEIFMSYYGNGVDPPDPPGPRRPRRSWQNRPPTIYYRTW